MKHVVIIPARDEGRHIGRALDSLLAQTVPPELIVVVDDGSMDDTREIVASYATRTSSVRLVDGPSNESRSYRVVEVFNRGYAELVDQSSEYVSKLDADLVLAPDYFERVLQAMDTDHEVAMACGTLYEEIGGKRARFKTPENHVPGALKTMRRDVFDEIGGFLPVLGWDIIDQVRLRQKGYRVVSLPDAEVLHLRRHGSATGIVGGNARMGHGAYVIGSHPLFIIGRAVYRMFETPYVIGGAALAYGYFRSWLARSPRIPDNDLIRALQREQLYRLLHRNKLPSSTSP